MKLLKHALESWDQKWLDCVFQIDKDEVKRSTHNENEDSEHVHQKNEKIPSSNTKITETTCMQRFRRWTVLKSIHTNNEEIQCSRWVIGAYSRSDMEKKNLMYLSLGLSCCRINLRLSLSLSLGYLFHFLFPSTCLVNHFLVLLFSN